LQKLNRKGLRDDHERVETTTPERNDGSGGGPQGRRQKNFQRGVGRAMEK